MDIWVVSIFWLLWIILLWTFMYEFLFEHLLSLLSICLGVELYGTSVFNLLRNCQSVFHSGCTILYPHQQCRTVLISLHPSQHLAIFCIYDYSHSSGCEVVFIVVLICIYLLTNDTEHIFHVLFGHLYIFFGEMSIQVLCPFVNWVFSFCWLVVRILFFFFLRSTGSRRAGSVVVAHGPRCSAACGIFPDQGSNPRPLHWQADSQPLRHQGSPMPLVLYLRNHCQVQGHEDLPTCFILG